MWLLVVVLALTNVATAALAWRLWHRQREPEAVDPALHEVVTAEVAPLRGPRRLISVEILNPIELASARGRMLAVAGSLAPSLVRHLVYERTIKELRQQLLAQQVAADVRLHVFRADGVEILEVDDQLQ